MRAQIGRITGRRPASRRERYLRRRLTELERREVTEAPPRGRGTGAAVMSVSMSAEGRAALVRILRREDIGASQAVRRALASWARERGYAREAALIE